MKWFLYYDKDRNNSISREELIKGLLDSNNNLYLEDSSPQQRDLFIKDIKQLWNIYDEDYSGQIERRDFLKRGGLAERLVILEKMKKDNLLQVQVNIKEGMHPNDRIKIISPHTQNLIILTIPEKSHWFCSKDGKLHYFIVSL